MMARIIHVEDKPEWVGIVRRALPDHDVDSATSYDRAMTFIRDASPPYDLALIDLNLFGQNDGMGAEILDVLRLEFPQTRRVVIAAALPPGNIRAVFERFGLDDVLIKGKTTIPGIQMVVIGALRNTEKEVPREVRIHDSELARSYRAWREKLDNEIQSHVRSARQRLRHSGRDGSHGQGVAKADLDEWLLLQSHFQAESAALEEAVLSAQEMDQVEAARKRLDEAIATFDSQIHEIQE